MKKYMIILSSGSAYQQGAITKHGKNPFNAIVAVNNWKWATKFESIEQAIAKAAEEEIKRFKVRDLETGKVVAMNGEIIPVPHGELLPYYNLSHL
jgi:hypothetical protein